MVLDVLFICKKQEKKNKNKGFYKCVAELNK